jgi:hypothetical protein
MVQQRKTIALVQWYDIWQSVVIIGTLIHILKQMLTTMTVLVLGILCTVLALAKV